jgi:hypothetical protein
MKENTLTTASQSWQCPERHFMSRPHRLIHAEHQSLQRQAIVHLCDRWTISGNTVAWPYEEAVTCPKCRHELARISTEMHQEEGVQTGAQKLTELSE